MFKFNEKLRKSYSLCLVGETKKTKFLLYSLIYLIAISTFLTVFSQLPFFTSRGLTQLFQIGWILVLIVSFFLDYKHFIKSFLIVFAFIFPFLIYSSVASFFNVNPFIYTGTKEIFLTSVIFCISIFFSKYKTPFSIKLILANYLAAAVLYGAVVYFSKLRGYDISNPIYAFTDKNSAGPIFLCASILSFYIFSKKQLSHILIRWAIFIFFIALIALSKNRAVLIITPLIFVVVLFFEIKKLWIKLIIGGVFLLSLILIFAIPQIYNTLIVEILLNNKTNIDDIFSGRLSQIIVNMSNIKPILGSGGTYFDCMPLSFLCSYGVIGFVSLLPIILIPFLIIFKTTSKMRVISNSYCFALIGISFLIGSLFEGFGYFGPGAKTFVLWILAGSFLNNYYLTLKHRVFVTATKKLDLVIDKLNPNYLLHFINICLVSFSSFLVIFEHSNFNIGSAVIDKLPYTNQIAQYTPVDNLEMVVPTRTMCVGQKITFGVDYSPKNADDVYVGWSSGSWIVDPRVHVNEETGEVEALTPGKTLVGLAYYQRTKSNPGMMDTDLYVKKYDDYNFDKLHISSNRFYKSFENTADEHLMMVAGETSRVYYDTFYLPKIDDFNFISSDDSIASVDPKTGLITAKEEGDCVISGILNNTFGNVSLNKIFVSIKKGKFIPVDSFDVELPTSHAKYTPLVVEPSFNQDATDKDFIIECNGVDNSIKNNIVTFYGTGIAELSITPENNPLLKKNYSIEISENQPVRFSCETTRIKIGEKKSAEQLGLFLEFSDGYKKIVRDSDLKYDRRDFSGRAWTNQSGQIDGKTSIMAVTKGEIKLKLKSIIDDSVEGNFTIVSSIYSKEEYIKACTIASIVLTAIVSAVTLSFSLMLYFKNSKLFILLVLSELILLSLLITLMFDIGVVARIIAPIILTLYSTLIILYNFKKKKKHTFCLNDPKNYKEIECSKWLMSETMEINI